MPRSPGSNIARRAFAHPQKLPEPDVISNLGVGHWDGVFEVCGCGCGDRSRVRLSWRLWTLLPDQRSGGGEEGGGGGLIVLGEHGLSGDVVRAHHVCGVV
eukprot:CAMPEP_0181205600 /NCGR_PEP_ID=MMETSP1096-20121128/20568_1 /TAXON_ID=156174 ORGANISM="Chrysochromulina ericina, Strain CCMP281" /NCGR_SAMPLE_ID=MMETSP1096 /ASSEMBLY_ACC=CAM_ASM_000453 /LENGTH=99 /DNA_ID=CAMNT_0023296403 /DNA_START=194 /DNA_END=493 /DNA_ORIENTATION=+